ncbi:unnamed protein product [Amaranthus hypochondriacus]
MAATNPILIVIGVLILMHTIHQTEATLGVCYGRKGQNLPCAQEVVNLYDYHGIEAMRLYDPDQDTLQALQSTWITLILGTLNEDIQQLASNQSFTNKWVQTNIIPYKNSIKYICVGNEIHPYDPQAPFVLQAMQSILNSLNQNNLGDQIKVSTAVDTILIENSYPPSDSRFKNLTYITPIIKFLVDNDSPLLVNIQPYFSYLNDPKNIRLDYALFKACGTVFIDDNSGLKYQNLFDAIYDAMNVAVQKILDSLLTENHHHSQYPAREGSLTEKLAVNNGKKNQQKKKKVKIVVSESGWPSKGKFHHGRKLGKKDEVMVKDELGSCGEESIRGEAATIENAKIYYTNLINHVKKGSPMTQGEAIETYLFATFDENEKDGDVSERNFGLFTPDQKPKYGDLDFCGC